MATTEVAEALLAHAALQEATVYGVTVPGTPRTPPRPTAPPIHSRAPQSALSPPTPRKATRAAQGWRRWCCAPDGRWTARSCSDTWLQCCRHTRGRASSGCR